MSDARTAEAVVAAAKGWLGTPYRHQASRKSVGCDCLGLVLGVWRELYGAAPETPGPYAPRLGRRRAGRPAAGGGRRLHCLVKTGAPEAGDLVLFRWKRSLPARHAGIMVAQDRFIHAYEGHAVLISALVPQMAQPHRGPVRLSATAQLNSGSRHGDDTPAGGGRVSGRLSGPGRGRSARRQGALAGYMVDRALVGSTQHFEGPRLPGQRLFSAEEGASIPRVYGTARGGGAT